MAPEEQRSHGRAEALGLAAAGVVHDVNNLLAVIANYAALAIAQWPAESPPDPARWLTLRGDLEQIASAAGRASGLTGRLLGHARPTVEETQELSVTDVVREALGLVQSCLDAHVALRQDLEPGCWRVSTDPDHLCRVVVNLVVNARDAMPDGGILTLRVSNVTLPDEDGNDAGPAAAGAGRRYVQLEVADTGTGIAADDVDRVFEPYYSTKAPGTGTGLGLAMVRQYVNELGGMVRVVSEPDSGTRFALLLPAVDSNAPAGVAG